MEKLIGFILKNPLIFILILPEIISMVEIAVFAKTGCVIPRCEKIRWIPLQFIFHLVLIVVAIDICMKELSTNNQLLIVFFFLWLLKGLSYQEIRCELIKKKDSLSERAIKLNENINSNLLKKILEAWTGILSIFELFIKKMQIFFFLIVVLGVLWFFFLLYGSESQLTTNTVDSFLIIISITISLTFWECGINYFKKKFVQIKLSKAEQRKITGHGEYQKNIKKEFEMKREFISKILKMKITLVISFLFIIIGIPIWYSESKREYLLTTSLTNIIDYKFKNTILEFMNNNNAESLLFLAIVSLIFIVSLYKICNKAEKKLREKSENITRKSRRQKYRLKAKRNSKF